MEWVALLKTRILARSLPIQCLGVHTLLSVSVEAFVEGSGQCLLWTVKRGKVAPSIYLRSPFAPIAEAAVRAA